MSRAYYNDTDPYAAAWLRNLIAAGHLPAGDVDERSIEEVSADDVRGYQQAHFFAGIGGWPLALGMAGWTGPVWTGSCPCQPFSVAGKRAGSDDPRHLWPAWMRLIGECRPNTIFGEQVPGAIGHGWLDLVSLDLEAEDYAVGSVVLGAHSVGAPHIRQRLWWVADADGRDTGTAWLQRSGEYGQGSRKTVALTAGWATPRVGNNGGYGNPERATDGKVRLEDQVQGWTTPQSHDAQGRPNPERLSRHGTKHGCRNLNDEAGLTFDTSLASTEKRGQLNPEFTRWLMGYPAEWGSCVPTATRSSRK